MGGMARGGVRNPDGGGQDPDGGGRYPDGDGREPNGRRRWVAWVACGFAALGLTSSGPTAGPAILPDMSVQTLVVDALEGDRARVEFSDGRVSDLPAEWLPAGAGEGHVLRLEVVGDGQVRIALDPDETERRRRENQALLDSITQKPPEDFHI